MFHVVRIQGFTRSHRGLSLVYALIALTTLVAVASLAVDYAKVELCRTELKRGVDASARAGAAQLAAGTSLMEVAAAKDSAVALFAMNPVLGHPVNVTTSDVEVGNWNELLTPRFATDRLPLNAVRVKASCSKARGNAVPLSAGSLLGIDTWDVNASAVATVDTPTSPYAMAGVDRVQFSSLGVLARIHGTVVSNGDIDIGMPLGVLVGVNGDARSHAGVVRKGGLAYISGSTSPLPQKLYYPPVAVPQTNDNSRIAGYLNSAGDFGALFSANIPAGSYVVRDLNLLAGVAVNLEGPATFYVTGDFNMAATVNLLGNPNFDPSNFKVRVLNGGRVNFLAHLVSPLNMDLYAPQTDISIAVGVNHYRGVLVGKSLTIALPVLGQFTEVRPPIVGDKTGEIRLVE
jgi:Flp pilus assembly protein TadG